MYSDVATGGEDGYDDGVAGVLARSAAVTQLGCGDVTNKGSGGVVAVTEGVEGKIRLEGNGRGEGKRDNVGRNSNDGSVLSYDGSSSERQRGTVGRREKRACVPLPIPQQLWFAALLPCPFGRR